MISFAGICIVGFGLRKYHGLLKCGETLLILLSIHSIIWEYFYIGYFYWSYLKKKKMFVRSIITLIITSFISICYSYNPVEIVIFFHWIINSQSFNSNANVIMQRASSIC
jgi:hypothetical protein